MMLDIWKPWANGARSLPSLVSDDLADAVAHFEQPFFFGNLSSSVPAADITETEDAVSITMDLPGHDPKQVQVSAEGETLTIRSERRREQAGKKGLFQSHERSYGVFARTFNLGDRVDASKAEAKLENGVLTVTLPKREEVKPKTIEVKVLG